MPNFTVDISSICRINGLIFLQVSISLIIRIDPFLFLAKQMMKLMKYVDTQENKEEFCVSWCEDGKSFIIRNPDKFTREVVPKFFKPTKFTSFTRKLYRWGFRQINRGIGPDDPIIFGNEYFRKDRPELVSNMRSVTAASTRKAEQLRMTAMGGYKRGFEEAAFGLDDGSQKRLFIDQLMQQQKHMMAHQNYYNGMSPNGSMPLSNALRPGLNMMSTAGGPGVGPMGSSSMMMGMNAPNGGGMVMNSMPSMQMQSGHPYMGGSSQGMGGQQMNAQQQPYGNSGAPPQQYPNAQTTTEIVNAAIAALRHAA